VRRLVGTADVLVENFRPGTLERWGLGPDSLDPSLVVVRISIFGQDGPSAHRPGLDVVALAASGLLALSGHPDGPPTKSGITVADHVTAVFAAQAALAALVERRRTGRGAVIDAPLHASVLRLLEWTIAAHDLTGQERTRVGSRGPHPAPSGVRAGSDGRFVAVVVEAPAHHAGLRTILGAAASPSADAALDGWIAARPAAEGVAALVAAGVPAAVVATVADIAADPHLRGRHDLVVVDDPGLGPLLQQAPFPRLGDAPPVAPTGAPRLGEHNVEVWCGELGLTPEELDVLRADGVV
jgi:crotonobetainyl-CoA:carnitine CoA-transferase CaiB-like acyl-CoA transferase